LRKKKRKKEEEEEMRERKVVNKLRPGFSTEEDPQPSVYA
jgi:hypothetical protein